MKKPANLYFKKLSRHAIEPEKQSTFAACYDVYADLGGKKKVIIWPKQIKVIGTGYAMCCDAGFKISLYARSSLAVKKGCMLANGVGVIDSDYRHEVKVPIYNAGLLPVVITAGERVAQIAVEEALMCEVDNSGNLPPANSTRNGGFGSTGTH